MNNNIKPNTVWLCR